jgi:hypothetical protein
MTQPGQIDLYGVVIPAEAPDPRLTRTGFSVVRADGRVYYRDPFRRPNRLLSRKQAHALLHERQKQVMTDGYRVHYPDSRASTGTSSRLGLRRATQEGAWHELRAFTGGHPHDGCWIVNDSGVRVWPPPEAPADV